MGTGRVMSDFDVTFSRLMLKMARADAKKAKIKIPKISTSKCSGFTNPYFQVWGPKGLVWEGQANNGYSAKAKYIEQLLKEYDQEVKALDIEITV
jgi:hypothetical protein